MKVLIPLWLAMLSGCASYGADAMRSSRLAYNEAIQHSEQRELLLNLIRMRYMEAPEFLAVNGISTQMTVEGSASLGGTFGDDGGPNVALVRPELAIGYSETPTVTFTPQRDRDFTRQLVAPIEIDSIYLLTRYGWGVDRVLRLVSNSVNGLANSLSREWDDHDAQEQAGEFAETMAVLADRERADQIRIGVEQRRTVLSPLIPVGELDPQQLLNDSQPQRRFEYQPDTGGYQLIEQVAHYQLMVSRAAWDDEQFGIVADKLGLPADEERFEIDPDRVSDNTGDGRLLIRTRSILGVLAYLSAAVAVPSEHTNQVFPAPSPELSRVFAGLLKIRSSRTPIPDAQLVVPYRDHWFYVADTDLESRKTLALLSSLVRLSINAGGAENVPVLTLPVGR